jgi:hypothetical protein
MPWLTTTRPAAGTDRITADVTAESFLPQQFDRWGDSVVGGVARRVLVSFESGGRRRIDCGRVAL